MNEVKIYTDGSSLGNPGPGGWGVVIMWPNNETTELGGREDKTTNNRMEMMAVINALEYTHNLKSKAYNFKIILDSEYVYKGITEWIHNWIRNNWRTKSKKLVLNQDLWQRLSRVVQCNETKAPLVWERINSHIGILGNERADEIAVSFAENNPVKLKNEK